MRPTSRILSDVLPSALRRWAKRHKCDVAAGIRQAYVALGHEATKGAETPSLIFDAKLLDSVRDSNYQLAHPHDCVLQVAVTDFMTRATDADAWVDVLDSEVLGSDLDVFRATEGPLELRLKADLTVAVNPNRFLRHYTWCYNNIQVGGSGDSVSEDERRELRHLLATYTASSKWLRAILTLAHPISVDPMTRRLFQYMPSKITSMELTLSHNGKGKAWESPPVDFKVVAVKNMESPTYPIWVPAEE